VHFEHHVAIGAERGDSIPVLRPCASQQSRKAMRPLSKLAIRKAAVAIDDGCALGKDFRSAIQEVRRVQWSCGVQRHSLLRLKFGLKLTLTRISH
jgi:hypothetical protein